MFLTLLHHLPSLHHRDHNDQCHDEIRPYRDTNDDSDRQRLIFLSVYLTDLFFQLPCRRFALGVPFALDNTGRSCDAWSPYNGGRIVPTNSSALSPHLNCNHWGYSWVVSSVQNIPVFFIHCREFFRSEL